MGLQRNTIPNEEYIRRMDELMPKLIQKRKCDTREEMKELFFLYNDRLTPRENKPECGGCRARVFKRMEAYYKTLKEENNGKP
jgi:hypothetical protein